MVAVGVHLTEDKLEAFQQKFEEEVTKVGLPQEIIKLIDADATLEDLSSIELQLFLDTFEPHGPLNPEPVFKVQNLTVYSAERKGDTLTIVFEDQHGWMLQCTKYHGADAWLEYEEQCMNVLLSPSPLYFTGLTDVKYQIIDMQPFTLDANF